MPACPEAGTAPERGLPCRINSRLPRSSVRISPEYPLPGIRDTAVLLPRATAGLEPPTPRQSPDPSPNATAASLFVTDGRRYYSDNDVRTIRLGEASPIVYVPVIDKTVNEFTLTHITCDQPQRNVGRRDRRSDRHVRREPAWPHTSPLPLTITQKIRRNKVKIYFSTHHQRYISRDAPRPVADRWPPAIRERPSPVGHWQRFGDPTPVLSASIPYVWIPYEGGTVECFYIFVEDPVFVEDNARIQFVPELC